MEIVGIRFKCRPNGPNVSSANAENILDNGEESVPQTRSALCKSKLERYHTFLPKRSNTVVLPTATAPKRGMIRLTALRGELENPRMYFGSSTIPSASSTGRMERMRKTQLRTMSPEKRICGVSYTPESLQSFGRQVTMTQLHRTVDSLIVDSTKRNDDGWNLPHIRQLDREVTRIIDSTDRHLLLRQDPPQLQEKGQG